MKKSRNYSFKFAIPFFYGKNKFLITRKSKWSIIDLFFLKTIAKEKISIEELVSYSNLKRQLVIQIILPFVKSGWVEIIPFDKSYVFSITDLGKKISERDSLPDFPEEYERVREYIIDPVSNRYYGLLKNSNIKIEPLSRIAELNNEGMKIKVFNIPAKSIIPDYNEVQKCVAYNDEHVNDTLFNNGRIEVNENRYVIFDVNYNSKSKKMWFNENYESMFSIELIHEVRNKFNTLVEQMLEENCTDNVPQLKEEDTKNFILKTREPLLEFHSINKKDLVFVYGGAQHKEWFIDLIRNSKSYLIIHSTFIAERAFFDRNSGLWTDIAIELKEALKRNVSITILFGKDKPDPDDLLGEDVDKNQFKSMKEILGVENLLERFNKECIDENILNIIQLNDHKKTGSHVKYIICDHKEYGDLVLTGSCNFFFSNFDRFEASVILMNNDVVYNFLMISSILCIAKDLHSNDLRDYFSSLANEIILKNEVYGEKIEEDCFSIAIVYKNQHYNLIDKAKVNAKNQIIILSDKLSQVSMNPVFEAIKNNTSKNKIVYFSSKSEFFKHEDEMKLREILKTPEYKINLQLYSSKVNVRSKSHAKVLAWDYNDLVITSLNWLSANATVANSSDIYHEIGIYIQGDEVVREFEVAFKQSING